MRSPWVRVTLLFLLTTSPNLSTQVAGQRSRTLSPLKWLETAHTLFVQGDFPKARVYYLKALPHYPQNFDLLKNLAYCYFAMGPRGFSSAARYYAQALKIHPSSRDVADSLAKCYMGLKRYHEAAAVYEKLASLPGAPPEVLKKAAGAFDLARRIPEAKAAYENYLQRSPGDLDARSNLGRLYSWEKNYDKALEQFRKVLSANANFPAALVGMGHVLAWQGRLEESLENYDSALRVDPQSDEAKAGKAFTLLWMGRAEDALAIFATLHERHLEDKEVSRGLEAANAAIEEKTVGPARRAEDASRIEFFYRQRLNKDPQDLAALKILAELNTTPQRCSEGIEYGRKANDLSPGDPALELPLARALASCRQYPEAIARYRRFIEFRPRDEDAWGELGETLLRARRSEEAADSFRNLLRLNPQRPDARLSLARALATTGNYTEALLHYNEVLKTSPDNYDALQGKAYVFYYTGQFAQAGEIFKTLAVKRPTDSQNAEALQNIARAEEDAQWAALRPAPGASPETRLIYYQKRLASFPNEKASLLGLASVLVELKNNQAAIRGYQRALELYPDERDAKLELARLLAAEGQYAASISLYGEALKSKPEDVATRESLARVYAWAGREREALEVFQGLLGKQPSSVPYKLEVARLRLRLKDYSAARQVLASILSADPQNREALLNLGRLDLAEKRWDESLSNFDIVLRQDPRDQDALLGKAQVSFYEGKLAQAHAAASALVNQQPNNYDAVFLLANIEHARGNRRGALKLLAKADQLSPNNPEVIEMRKRLREESAVTLHLSVSFAREIGAPTEALTTPNSLRQDLPNEDLRMYAYNSMIEFSRLRRTDSYLTFTSLPSDSPPGPLRDSQGQQIPTGITGAVGPAMLLYRQTTHVSSRVDVRAGAGLVKFGSGDLVELPGQPSPVRSAEERPLGLAGLTFAPIKKFSLDLNAARSPVGYTPVSVKFGVVEDRLEGGLNFFPIPRTELHLAYYYSHYSTKQFDQCFATDGVTAEGKACHDQAHGGSAVFTWNLVRSKGFSFDVGYNGLAYGFAGQRRKVFLGFFNPSFYQLHLLAPRFYGKLGSRWGYDISGGAGLQQTLQGRALTLAWSASPSLTLKASQRLTLGIGYTHYNTAQALGSVRGNAVRLTSDWRL